MNQKFRPERIPRAGERNAWLIAALAVTAWVQEVRIVSSRWGERVQVLGFDERKPFKGQSASNVGFVFHTLSEIEYQGKIQGRTGFKQGQFILKQVLDSSGLEERSNDQQGRYYARL